MKRVVVTGMGLVSPIGQSLDTFWQNLLASKSGITRISRFDTENFESKIAGEIQDFDPSEFISRKEIRRMDRFTHFAMAATQLAVQDSQIDFEQVEKERFGVLWGSGIGGMQVFEDQCRVLFDRGPDRVSPFMIPMLIPDIAPGHISILYGLKGINYATVSACASAAHAIGDSLNHIRHGRADGVVSGGSEAPITQMGISAFCALKALSTRNDDPEHASRPFDLKRDGFVMGEGGGTLILEELEHAKARGAKIYAELIGAGYSADAYHITQPVPGGEGAQRAMTLALQDAGIEPTDVDYINAHGTSTEFNDKTETTAIKHVLGDHAYNIAVNSTKSMTGHLLGASAAVEAIATILQIQNSTLHPTANLQEPDPECDLFYVPNEPQKRDIRIALSNSFGFGGHNVTLVFKRFES
ncbi:beta-ketoacyl-ACP synthase II [candidate division KSB1 bacterium]|jgi:3-oxoacyl-[acyl-carrier-protein] synthase II|nr:beta-ketoacyl-ACP synthase II [candidate division KSB1 bacterium]